jgi:AcrR family transcriptional regulator
VHVKEVATALFARYGFEGVSTADISEKAGISDSMISHYFGGKNELYDSILDDLFQEQNDYLKDFIPQEDFYKLSRDEKISAFTNIIDKIIDIAYKNLSSDMIMIMLREQQNRNVELIEKSPIISYLRRLIADIFEQEQNSKLVIYLMLSIISLIASPRFLPGFSLGLLHQENFKSDDMKMIHRNLKICLKALLNDYLRSEE